MQALPLFVQRALGAVAQGHVLQAGQNAQRLAVGAALDDGRQQHVDQLAAARDHLDRQRVVPALRQQHGQADGERKFTRGGGEELNRAAAQHLRPGIAQAGQPGVTDHRQPALHVNGVQHRRCRFVQAAQAVFTVGDGGRAVRQRQRGTCRVGHRLLGQLHGVPALQRMRGHRGQAAQGLALHVGKLARLVVDQAQRAHPVAVAQLDWRAGIKPDAQRAGHQRVVGKTWVLGGIGHLEHRITAHGMGTKSQLTRRLGDAGQADVGLEPLALGIDQAEQRDRHPAQQ